MGAQYTYVCGKCGYSVSTSVPWEFYRDKKGKRKHYGHPVPTSEEACQSGIYGFLGEVYCPYCDKTFALILVEFKKPSHDGLAVWSGMCEVKDEYKDEGAVKCPKCNNLNLVLASTKEMVCPRCKEGKLSERAERGLRASVIMGRITFSNISPAGVRNHQVMMSILEIASLHHVEPLPIFLSLARNN